ncbi:UNVERIFIED_CONTAM: hypothetical protein GTU68_061617, partial [Idotea baltica]|nr:hypothetical protein [Idotea baltica]
RINEQIRKTPIRVIDQDGNQLGVIPTREALDKARDAGLDLVEVAGDANPPVCRIMDFGKFNYDKKKRQTKNKSHQTKLKRDSRSSQDWPNTTLASRLKNNRLF